MKKIFLSLLVLTALMAGARTIIMSIEMKDGNVRHVDTEQVDEFNFIHLDQIPETQPGKTFTDTLWADSNTKLWVHDGYFKNTDRNLSITRTYVPNDPSTIEFKISNWGDGCKPIKMTSEDYVITVECQPTGIVDKKYGAIWVADEEHYYSSEGAVAGSTIHPCLYPGTYMNLNLVYYAPDYHGDDKYAVFANEFIFPEDTPQIGLGKHYLTKTDDGKDLNYTIELADYYGFAHHIEVIWEYFSTLNEAVNGFVNEDLKKRLLTEGGTKVMMSPDHSAVLSIPANPEKRYVTVWYKVYDKYGLEHTTINRLPAFLCYGVADDKYVMEADYYYNSIAKGSQYIYNGTIDTKRQGTKVDATYNFDLRLNGKSYTMTATASDICSFDENGYVDLSLPETCIGDLFNDSTIYYVSPSASFAEKYPQFNEVERTYLDVKNQTLQLHVVYYAFDKSGNLIGYADPAYEQLTFTAYAPENTQNDASPQAQRSPEMSKGQKPMLMKATENIVPLPLHPMARP